MGCYIWYSEEGPGRAGAPPSPLFAVPNVTAHPSTASVPITVLLLYNGPLLCGFVCGHKELIVHETGIATLVRRVEKTKVTVGMDGGLYRFHPEFHRILTKTIADLLTDKYKVSSCQLNSLDLTFIGFTVL